jgi:transposase-like protein
LTKRARVNRAFAFRARIVLACIDSSNTAVARRLRTTKTTVAKWRRQFVERRLEGLYDEPRVGAPRTISDEQAEAIIVKTLETTPPGETYWSTRSMAKAAGVSHTMVWRISDLADVPAAAASHGEFQDLAGSATRGKDSGRGGLVRRATDECRVFSVGEKSQIQALQRAQPVLPMDFGQPERRTHNYVRHGTLDLLPPSMWRRAR